MMPTQSATTSISWTWPQGEAKLLQENASQPAFAPGGRRLAFRNHHPSYLGLSILDLDSQEISEVTVHPEDSTPAWSPDPKQIVFASDKHGDRKWRIYVISPGEVRGEGEEWAFGQMPAWSPRWNGQTVAYHGCDERGDKCAVWVMKAGGFSPARLTTDPSDTAPAWSPDGSAGGLYLCPHRQLGAVSDRRWPAARRRG